MDRPFNLLDYSIAFRTPRRLTDIASWHGHIPFAFMIVEMLKPQVFVELGTHKGDSYCAFCQAVHVLRLNCACYAVDTWEGDEQAGFYGNEVFEELFSYHNALYGSFSRLIRAEFDQTLNHFSDSSIDLLHIDGHHTYDSVRHDFDAWRPKMSRRGVVLLHDTMVHEQDFGVWRLWEELRDRYPSFEFMHAHGLGVLGVGDDPPEAVRSLLELSERDGIWTRRFFSALGERIVQGRRIHAQERQLQALQELYLHSAGEGETRGS